MSKQKLNRISWPSPFNREVQRRPSWIVFDTLWSACFDSRDILCIITHVKRLITWHCLALSCRNIIIYILQYSMFLCIINPHFWQHVHRFLFYFDKHTYNNETQSPYDRQYTIVYFVHIRSFPHLQVTVLVFLSFLNVSMGE